MQLNFVESVEAARRGDITLDEAAQGLLSQLSQDERLSLLDGDEPYWSGLHELLIQGYNHRPYIHGAVDRLKISGVRFADGPRGCVLGHSTAFPVPMARGASWDVTLEERIGHAIGRECRAQGANFFGGVCVNLPRHPAWGRIQETYGEDPVLLGELGLALTRGVQRNMMACVKHYALNSMENARFQVDVDVDLPVLHEVYLAHFLRIIEGNKGDGERGAAAVMSSYNSVRGEFAGQNEELLTKILRDEWGFKGLVISDFLFGLRDAPLSLKNGLDIEAPFANLRHRFLKEGLETGQTSWSDVERASLRILRSQLEDAVRREQEEPGMDVVFSRDHRELAREAAIKSMVLLKNERNGDEKLLPLENLPSGSKIAVIGRLANSANTGDRGSSAVRSPAVVTPFEGLKEAVKDGEIILDDTNTVEGAERAAASADLAIVIVGYDWRDEGEFTIPPLKTDPALKNVMPPLDGTDAAKVAQSIMMSETSGADVGGSDENYGLGAGGDRDSLRLNSRDVEIIRAVAAKNQKTIVCIIAAGTVIMDDWDKLPSAILYSWYAGSEGGHALADLLLGRANFSGRLPFSIPSSEFHLPFFDKNAKKITYDRWFGQRLLDRDGLQAAYPLGFGLSYTTFVLEIDDFQQSSNAQEITVKVKVSNTGSRDGRAIVQVYGTMSDPERPARVLLGFQPVDLAAGTDKHSTVTVSTRPLQVWDNGTWRLHGGELGFEVSSYWGSEDLQRQALDPEKWQL